MLMPLQLPPGVYKNGTRYQSQGRFYDADLWRWFENTQRPVGGWRIKSDAPVSGAGRAVHTWIDNSNQTWIAVGTNEGLFVFTRGGVRHDITPAGFVAGAADATTGGGYGRGKYGRGRYGTPRPDSTNVIPAMVWTLDNWGEVLIACDGRDIYQWELDTGDPATLLPNAPSAEAIFCTEELAIVALGAAGDPRKVEWCDPEDRTAWTSSGTNLAGGFRVQTTGRLRAGKRLRGGAILYTGVDAHLMSYNAGSPDVYDIQRLATSCGSISRQAPGVVDGRSFWFGLDRFWSFNGVVEPLECDVGDYVFGDINRGQVSKITVVHIASFGEMWWFYPSASSIENNRYVVHNYREGHWNVGELDRLCGVGRGETLQYPLMVGTDGHLYEHEVGQNRGGRQPYAISGPVEIGNGERTYSLYAIIPDETNLGDVQVSFTTGDWTMSPDGEEGPFDLSDRTDIRLNARRIAVKMIATPDRDFRVGIMRFEARAGSPR